MEGERCWWRALGGSKDGPFSPYPSQMRMNVSCCLKPAAAPPATTHWAASTVSVPLALTLTRPWGAARMWMSVQHREDPVATAAPTPLVFSCVAAPKATSGLGKGQGLEWGAHRPSNPGSVYAHMGPCTHTYRHVREWAQSPSSTCRCIQAHTHYGRIVLMVLLHDCMSTGKDAHFNDT